MSRCSCSMHASQLREEKGSFFIRRLAIDCNRDDENYPKLLRHLLQGHPRAMEVVLPQLRWNTPSAMIEELQHNLEAYPEILDASSEYAFSQIPEEARKHLLLLCLFTSFVNLDRLKIFVAGELVEKYYSSYLKSSYRGSYSAAFWAIFAL